MPATIKSSPDSQFAATRWSIVLAAGAGDRSAARRAMGELAAMYWFPLYAYLRRRGNSAAEAEDLVQGFFARVVEKEAFAGVSPARGKFRSFLLASMQHFASNEWDKARAQKRGGGKEPLALDAMAAEARYAAEPVDAMTPERVYERRWALAVLEQVLGRLRKEYEQRGQAEVFAALERVLVGGSEVGYAEMARGLKMTEGAMKVAGHRLRKRYRQLLREEIGHTVAEPGLVDEEIRQLLSSL